MKVEIVLQAVNLIIKVLDAANASSASRDRIAKAIQDNRPITEAELDQSLGNLQDAIDSARED